MTAEPDRSYVCPVLVARVAQLQAIERGLDMADRGTRGAFVLTGEAGIGKSRLVSEAASRAAGSRRRSGSCSSPSRSACCWPAIVRRRLRARPCRLLTPVDVAGPG